MRFISPQYLWFLLLLPLAYVVFTLDEKRRLDQFRRFAQDTLWKTIAPEMNPGARQWKARVWLLAIGFGIFALARPQWGMHEETVKLSGLDVMLVLDLSNSMEVEDVVPSRLKKAKHVIRTLAERLAGDRVGLIGFAGGASLVTPLTSDIGYVLENLEILGPKSIPTQGTDIGVALDGALKALDRGSEGSESVSKTAASSRAIILITDGEDQEGHADDMAVKVKESGTKFYALGIGTEKGGPIPIRGDTGTLVGYKKDRRNQPIVSSFRPDSLLQIASLAGGRYWSVTENEDELDELLKDVGALDRSEFSERKYLVYEDRFQVPLAIAVLLLLLEISIPTRKIVLLLALCLIPMGRNAMATPIDTYVDNEKGVKAYNQGNLDEARQEFGAAQARDPARPELEYNQGLVQLQDGKVDEAIRSFESSARKSLQKNPALAGRSMFNLGVALSKKGDIKSAIRSYRAAIGAAEGTKDSGLEGDSRKNLELLLKEQEKQKQQQQDQQKQQQQQQQQQQQNQQSQQDPSQDPKQSPEHSSPKDQHSQGKKQFKSEKLSPEDAEKVMQDLSNREKELQAKMKNQYGRRNDNTKDW